MELLDTVVDSWRSFAMRISAVVLAACLPLVVASR